MARQRKTLTKEATVEKTASPVIEAESSVVETKEIKVPEKKKFSPTDGILCRAILSGKTYIKGKRTGTIYGFLGAGDEIEIEYQDLVAEVREGSGIIFHPMIVVEDEDFIKEFPKLEKYYKNMYTQSELMGFLKKPANQVKGILPTLPAGVQDSLKSIAAEMIRSKQLDSLSTIKALDEVWGTNLVLMTGFFDEDE